jgi:hypothetical protein
MKRNLMIVIFAAMLFATLNVGPIPAARAMGNGGGCSTGSVSGFYGFTYAGEAILPSSVVPVGAVGNFSTDAAGNFVGTEINNLGGTPAYQTIKGKITVDNSCAGTLLAQVYQAGKLVRTSTVHLQYDNNARDVRLIFQKVELPDHSVLPVVITGDGKRVSSGD